MISSSQKRMRRSVEVVHKASRGCAEAKQRMLLPDICIAYVWQRP
jgi:hypothetical protein